MLTTQCSFLSMGLIIKIEAGVPCAFAFAKISAAMRLV